MTAMLILTNDRTIIRDLGLVPLLQRLSAAVRVAREPDVVRFLDLVGRSHLEPSLIVFRLDPHRVLDGVDWVSGAWDALERNHVPIIAALLDRERVREALVVTHARQTKVEHLDPANLSRAVEILLTVQYDFLLDEFAEHDFPGLNDSVTNETRTLNVQTQYYPGDRPRISTEVYRDGRIVKTFTHHVKDTSVPRRKLLFLIEDLHQKVLANLEMLAGE